MIFRRLARYICDPRPHTSAIYAAMGLAVVWRVLTTHRELRPRNEERNQACPYTAPSSDSPARN